MQHPPSPLKLRQRLGYPIRVAGFGDDVSEAVKQVGQGIGDAARSAGAGLGEAAAGIGSAAGSAAASVSDAADSAATTAKWTIAATVAVPITLGLAVLGALAYASRGAAKTVGEHPELLTLLGPEGAAAAALVSAVAPKAAQNGGRQPGEIDAYARTLLNGSK
jgi:hypothetical protein